MKKKEIYLAGGCFWGVQAYFENIQGVTYTEVGYANGHTPNPTYEQVCSGTTNHAETLYVVYDEEIVSLPFLLDMYFAIIDPTLYHQQGNDIGSQYRTGIYYVDENDKVCIITALDNLQQSYTKKIVVECEPLSCFYPAEEYHQQYLRKNPNGYCHISKAKIAAAKNTTPQAY